MYGQIHVCAPSKAEMLCQLICSSTCVGPKDPPTYSSNSGRTLSLGSKLREKVEEKRQMSFMCLHRLQGSKYFERTPILAEIHLETLQVNRFRSNTPQITDHSRRQLVPETSGAPELFQWLQRHHSVGKQPPLQPEVHMVHLLAMAQDH